MADALFTHELHFHDRRPPQEIQAGLERDLRAPLTPVLENGVLEYRGSWAQGWLAFHAVLRFEAALRLDNVYSLRIMGNWPPLPQYDPAEMSRQCASWCEFWLRNFTASAPVTEAWGERYEQLKEEALAAEDQLASVPAVQQKLLTAMRDGREFSTAHKEGGSVIRWRRGRFQRSDYGEWTAEQQWTGDEEFLAFLRQFYSHLPPAGATEATAWKLIYRQLA